MSRVRQEQGCVVPSNSHSGDCALIITVLTAWSIWAHDCLRRGPRRAKRRPVLRRASAQHAGTLRQHRARLTDNRGANSVECSGSQQQQHRKLRQLGAAAAGSGLFG